MDESSPLSSPALLEQCTTNTKPAHHKRTRVIARPRSNKRYLPVLSDEYKEELVELEVLRPRTRADCEKGIRPCPFVSCRYHLYLDVKEKNGSITCNYPDKEPDELEESCALDVADRGGNTLAEVGDLLQITRERARQIEEIIFRKIKDHPNLVEIQQAGGFEPHEDDAWITFAEGEGGGGGEAESDPEKIYANEIWRIYERVSRERTGAPTQDEVPLDVEEVFNL